MNRRTFAQSIGGATALTALASSPAFPPSSPTAKPGKLMAIAAHPGDGMFTMGAALAQQIERGGSGILLSLSLGEKGAPKTIPVHQYGEMQRDATLKAMALLAGQAIFLSYPDAEIPCNDEISLRVCDAIREHKPTIIVTHWKGSWHKDHRNCHLVVNDAIFYAGLATLSRPAPPHSIAKTFYADNWEDADNYLPDTHLDISSVRDKWLQACSFYPMWRGETGFRYNDYYSSLSVMRGCLSGFKHAVALMSDASQRLQRSDSL
jgi:LmbE family N-acetylglucosaminyl deacetylase